MSGGATGIFSFLDTKELSEFASWRAECSAPISARVGNQNGCRRRYQVKVILE